MTQRLSRGLVRVMWLAQSCTHSPNCNLWTLSRFSHINFLPQRHKGSDWTVCECILHLHDLKRKNVAPQTFNWLRSKPLKPFYHMCEKVSGHRQVKRVTCDTFLSWLLWDSKQVSVRSFFVKCHAEQFAVPLLCSSREQEAAGMFLCFHRGKQEILDTESEMSEVNQYHYFMFPPFGRSSFLFVP